MHTWPAEAICDWIGKREWHAKCATKMCIFNLFIVMTSNLITITALHMHKACSYVQYTFMYSDHILNILVGDDQDEQALSWLCRGYWTQKIVYSWCTRIGWSGEYQTCFIGSPLHILCMIIYRLKMDGAWHSLMSVLIVAKLYQSTIDPDSVCCKPFGIHYVVCWFMGTILSHLQVD